MTTIDYQDFLKNKFIRAEKSGKEVADSDIHPSLFPFQRDITRWAIRKGRALCPLQLGTVERCLKLYSNPGELVLSPFMGIGSEIYQAVRFGRRGIGIELKPSYFDFAVKNLKTVETEKKRIDLFQYAETQSKETPL